MIVRAYRHYIKGEPSPEQRFVFSGFCLQTGEPEQSLRDLLRDGAKMLMAVAPDERRENGSELFYGWAGAHRGRLVYAYVKHDLRHFPVIPRLLAELGIEPPVQAVFDSVSMRAMARAFGWRATFAKESQDARREVASEDRAAAADEAGG